MRNWGRIWYYSVTALGCAHSTRIETRAEMVRPARGWIQVCASRQPMGGALSGFGADKRVEEGQKYWSKPMGDLTVCI
jgi:hypothetical protein